jgi:hypothetical protein
MNDISFIAEYGLSPQHIKRRLGKATASRMKDICKKQKNGGYYADRANYLKELVYERLTNREVNHFRTSAMQRGIELEPRARATYELREGVTVDRVGFVDHPTLLMSGASPDGLIGDDGGLEIKCPEYAVHQETLVAEDIPEDNLWQMHWNMACLPERQWWDFVSFNPEFPASMTYFGKRLMRDDAVIAKMTEEVELFLQEVDQRVAYLMERYGAA